MYDSMLIAKYVLLSCPINFCSSRVAHLYTILNVANSHVAASEIFCYIDIDKATLNLECMEDGLVQLKVWSHGVCFYYSQDSDSNALLHYCNLAMYCILMFLKINNISIVCSELWKIYSSSPNQRIATCTFSIHNFTGPWLTLELNLE